MKSSTSRYRANVETHFRTILVSYAVWLVNKDADDWLVIRSGDFRMNQFQSVIDCYSFGDCLHSLLNRTGPHPDLRKSSRPKEKVGANPPDDTAALRASRELYGKGIVEASWPSEQEPTAANLPNPPITRNLREFHRSLCIGIEKVLQWRSMRAYCIGLR